MEQFCTEDSFVPASLWGKKRLVTYGYA